ncbi:MAG: hypothetical protein U0893_22940 [Chloroflexota bacterium]
MMISIDELRARRSGGHGAIARHRQQTEQAIRQVKEDALLSERERIGRITTLLAEANGRALALWDRGA